MRFPRTISARLILVVTLGTSVIFSAMLSFNHLRSRALLEQEVARSAQNLALASVNRVESVLVTTARAAENLAHRLETSPTDDAELRALMQRLLTINPEIHGTSVSFEPEIQAGRERLHAPYYYRNGERMLSAQLEDSVNYTLQDWYQIPRELARADWSEPYYDRAGGNTLMATYSVPFYSGSGENRRIRGIVTVDVSLDQLTQTISAIQVLDTGYAFLVSRNGAMVTHPVTDYIMNETIFSLAEAAGDADLREVGRRMLRGESGFVPYRGFSGMPARLHFSPIPGAGWSLGIVFPEDELFAGIRTLTFSVAAIGVLGILLIALVVVLIARSITRPIRELATATRQISEGDFALQLPVNHSRDEVGTLSRAFVAMSLSLQEHIRELVTTTSAKERIEGELSIAHDIQMSILPRMLPPFPNREEFNLFAVIEPAKEVGGDFYDFFQIDDKHLCLVIADVSGKGVPASLFMAVTKTLIKATAKAGLSPADILGRVNDEIAHDNEQSMFVTVFCAILDLRSGVMSYTNAGHNPPVHMPCRGLPVYLPRSPQLVIGAVEGYVYRVETLTMAPGDRLFLYTDGVTEAMAPQDRPYSDERLLELLTAHRQESIHALIDTTVADIRTFADGAPQSDDITLLVIEFIGPAAVQGTAASA